MNNDGLCPFLGKDKLCKVQKNMDEGFYLTHATDFLEERCNMIVTNY